MTRASDLAGRDIDAVPRGARTQGPAALHHLRQRRRRQEHADRPAALRIEGAATRISSPRSTRRLEEVRHAGRRSRLRAAARRPDRRARAGHHDRRRVPVLLDRQAQLHRRRHAGPRAVHAQHGHRRLDGRRRRHPGRRAQGRADADAAAQLPRLAARHPQGRARRQQDRSRRLFEGDVRRDRARTIGRSPRRSGSPRSSASRSRRSKATTSRARARTRPGIAGRR